MIAGWCLDRPLQPLAVLALDFFCDEEHRGRGAGGLPAFSLSGACAEEV